MTGIEMGFLPVTNEEREALGWSEYDFLFISADAYCDHPSFGAAIISRVLAAEGYKVMFLAQPDWRSKKDFVKFGRPKYGVFISGGNIDSMVNHYTAAKKPRSEDLYSPGGKAGLRPDRCTIVYTNRVREAFGDIPVIIGGPEASMRRFAHYDYWDNKVRRSVIFDSRADIISYGMGEKQTVAIAEALSSGIDVCDVTWIDGTAYVSSEPPEDAIILPSFEEVKEDKAKYAKCTLIEYEEQDPIRGKRLAQKHGDKYLVVNPPMIPLTEKELDRAYSLPYVREYHPSYEKDGGIPAFDEVRFSITSARGCFGNCNFCSLAFHQGRIVQSRSHASIINEAKNLTYHHLFKGYIHDVGGPSANFRSPACDKQLKTGTCKNRQCLFPTPCKSMNISHDDYGKLLSEIREIDGVKKVFVRSGIRYDYLISDKDDSFFYDLCKHHVSGQLKVAPEHVSDRVLRLMGKPSMAVYEKFSKKFYEINKAIGKEQYLVPYLMSSHPGSTLEDAIELALFLKKNNLRPQQVQDFYPTPGTLSTAMFYTELDPFTMKHIYVPKTPEEKAMQRALLQYTRKENYKTVKKALTLAGREELIGFSPNCLIRPERRNNDESKNTGRKSSVSKNKKRAEGRGGSTKGKGNKGRAGGNNR